ncbi:MAG: 4Fe-4S binding protein, partial [Burkholderiaceae bacterium]|nr:4Fe-4S binding protein [Burkholderiaceae bacterium]
LAQGLIPAAGMGVFLGLSATTLTLLQHEGLWTGWANPLRFTLLALALAWSLRIEWRLTGMRTRQPGRRLAAVALVCVGLLPFCWAWLLLFVIW